MAGSRKAEVLRQFHRYWIKGPDALDDLEFPETPTLDIQLPPKMVRVAFPTWASDLQKTEMGIPVPEGMAPRPDWSTIDWFSVAYWYLHGAAERAWEEQNKPIHSYASQLEHWPSELWEAAWANRIALFLRRFAARKHGCEEEALFGPLPEPGVFMTHDVDGFRKTPANRLKQSVAFALLGLEEGRSLRERCDSIAQGLRFLFAKGDYDQIEAVLELEATWGVKSQFNFYAGRHTSAHSRLMDPHYAFDSSHVSSALKRIQASGCRVGLHPGFRVWKDSGLMAEQRELLSRDLGDCVRRGRQHWLRFSWRDTWSAQRKAGLREDATLGFNDRPGFRVGTASVFYPFGDNDFTAIPTILMDSQLCMRLSPEDMKHKIRELLTELKEVHGYAAVIWHQRVLSPDYGWRDGFVLLLQEMSRVGLACRFPDEY